MKLQQFFEFINGKSGVPDYTTHCVGIDRIITGDLEVHGTLLFPVL